jgi:hypothetical protein
MVWSRLALSRGCRQCGRARSEAPAFEEQQLGTPATELSKRYDQLARATVRDKLIVI